MQLSAPSATDRAAAVEAFRPFPGAPTWDVRAVAGVMARLYPPPAQEGTDGWRVARHRDAVAVGRILRGHGSRPTEPGPDQREWDAWIRTDREHLSASGLEILRADDVRTVVRVPLPAEPQCTATVRRIGAPSALTSRVEFPQWPGIGGTVRYFPIPGRPERGRFEKTHPRNSEPTPGKTPPPPRTTPPENTPEKPPHTHHPPPTGPTTTPKPADPRSATTTHHGRQPRPPNPATTAEIYSLHWIGCPCEACKRGESRPLDQAGDREFLRLMTGKLQGGTRQPVRVRLEFEIGPYSRSLRDSEPRSLTVCAVGEDWEAVELPFGNLDPEDIARILGHLPQS